MGTRAVIFDLDGTLLDTEPLLDEANAAVLGRYGCALTHEIRGRVRGRSRHDADRILAEAAGVEASVLGAERAAILDRGWGRAELMPGAARLVARVAERGLPMAIATSSSTAALAAKLSRHAAIRAAMSVIVCADHPLVRRSKPAPDVFEVAARELGVEAGACLVFEDAPAGVRGALAAGMRVVAVCAELAKDEAAFAGASAIVGSLEEIDPAAWA
jgi:pseudouridine-5'-monophosphatase